jgi:hypothetical protein
VRAAGRGALIVVAVLLAARAAAGIPDWAKAVAETAPPIPDGMPEWPERTLLAETSIVVSADGASWRIRRRKVIQVLSNRVEETAFGFFAFDDTTKVKKSKGWHVPPGERAERNTGGALDLSLPNNFLTDSKARVVALDGVRKGSLVVYEFEAESHPYTLAVCESYHDDAPVSLARWSIEFPAGWTLKHAWLPDGGPDPFRAGAAWVFERRDLAPAREEPLGDDPAHLGPRLVVALEPPAGLVPATPAFPDWNAVGRWYEGLAKGRDAATPAIQAAVKDLLATAGPQPLDRIRAVSLFVRDRVRYVAREVGIGGYQPHFASQVFSELYGDCKDKGTLLRAALAAAGFVSYPLIIHASNPYTVSADVPALDSFNHFVIGVLWPKDVPVPVEAASAIVDAGGDGTLLVIDPTDERAWPGTLPDNLAGKTGLAVIAGRGVLVTLPAGSPSWHRIARAATVSFVSDGSVAIRRVSRLYGGPAEEARHANAASFKDRREAVERDIRAAWPGAEIKDYAVTSEDGDGAYVETVSIALVPSAPALQENAYWLFSGATQDIDRVPLGKRQSAVQYPYPLQVRYEVTVAGVPSVDPVPTAQHSLGDGWSVETAFDRSGDTFHGVWISTQTRTRFEPSAFPELKQFWSASSKAASPGLTIPP